ncbi:DM13 domain-containing protein [Actinomadura macrotermitis]|uniref:DM13 domain-containing protein n=1 Tax=Actinomadura macrotermitis TaxID=2585200 RepID=A0A7K0BXS4_9ACTN|nr:DM13 domain-containing protein [Actinomadura macrotermitis]MQY05652.1 hypothetical protein [Actinomadura macrotermitis]
MMRKRWIQIGLVAFVVVGAAALYLTQPWRAFVDREVNETVPTAAAATPAAAGAPSTPAAPAAQVLARGTFVTHEHDTSGKASVVRLPDGKTILRIEDLDTSDGPDLRVWLSDQPVKEGSAGWSAFDDGAYVELGKLKGNKGSQNYTIPAGTDLKKLTSVSIWCKRFHVSFGAAALRA